jgi:hypothetical protein
MNAPANIVIFGIRVILPSDEIESIDMRKHSLVVRARESKLQTYYGNFGGVDPLCYLPIGRIIGVTGPENKTEVEVTSQECLQIIDQVQERLKAGKYEGIPKLYGQLRICRATRKWPEAAIIRILLGLEQRLE